MVDELSDAPDRDAALSLCAIGHNNFLFDQPRRVSAEGEDCVLSSLSADTQEPIVSEDDRSRTPERSSPPLVNPHGPKAIAPSNKRTLKRRESKQRDRVSFEEMKRLMRVYGPTKCLRNRTPRESGKSAKVLSVKRKFYRWFPDFHDRFVLQAGGWYKPAIGHEEEMRYREDSRREDQRLLAAKRNLKKCGLRRAV
ncbi:hypothetical protein ACHAWF_012984 [Thalassiosira exigua]